MLHKLIIVNLIINAFLTGLDYDQTCCIENRVVRLSKFIASFFIGLEVLVVVFTYYFIQTALIAIDDNINVRFWFYFYLGKKYSNLSEEALERINTSSVIERYRNKKSLTKKERRFIACIDAVNKRYGYTPPAKK